MEFTKLSPNADWAKPVSEPPERGASFASFHRES